MFLLSSQLRTNYEQALKQQVAEQTAELAQIRDLREAIFNESTDAILLVESSPQTRILDCNQRTVELFEVESKQELIGIEGTTLQKQPYTAAEMTEIGAKVQRKGFWNGEMEFVTKSRSGVLGQFSDKTYLGGRQRVQLARLTDISDRKQLEAQLQHAGVFQNAEPELTDRLSNQACKFIPNDQSYILFSVQDRGRGIPTASGQAGLEQKKREIPDAILLDISMPGMDGFSVFEQL